MKSFSIKTNIMNLQKFQKALQNTPLKARLQVSSSMAFLDILEDFGVDTSSEHFLNNRKTFVDNLNKHVEGLLRNIHEWERDGKPIDL